jgi:hypothetical protein
VRTRPGMEALLEPEMERAWIGDCRQPDALRLAWQAAIQKLKSCCGLKGWRFKVFRFNLQVKVNYMVLKIFKGVWFLSLIVFLGVFIYQYASLPEKITLQESETPLIISRDGLFYAFVATVALINMLVFVVTRLFPAEDMDFKSWFYGLVITLNIFFIVGISFISLYNSTEKFDYESIGIIIYGSLGLIVVWSLGWPVYALSRKYFFKQSV